jgi:tetratricopeptide (TPR) repeat protein
MGNAIGRSLASPRLSPASVILILFFVVAYPSYPSTTQRPAQTPGRQQEESGTSPKFVAALRAYKAQQYAVAQKQLQAMAEAAPESFEVNELLGLVYVAQGDEANANQYLAKAVRLKPKLPEARTALATNLLALHRADEAEIQFRKAVELRPNGYDANHNLGEFYIQTGKIASAIPFLERAQQADETAYNNAYDLALALEQSGRLDEARQHLQHLISLQDSVELHSLLGEVEEKSRNYVSAAAQYEQAARMEPSEQNILNWGAELLLHQTFAPAIDVFKAGTLRFPDSTRLNDGLGIAFYGSGQTDDAVRAFFRASDLAPSDALPLTFLGKACDSAAPSLADQVRSRLQNSIARDTKNAELHYYLAVCLRKTSPTDSTAERDSDAETLLKRAVALDPNYADAYFQLGALYADQHKYKEASERYELALKINPNAANTHYRLAQVLARLGNQTRAQEELAVFERLRRSESDATSKGQSEIQQFVYRVRKADIN